VGSFYLGCSGECGAVRKRAEWKTGSRMNSPSRAVIAGIAVALGGLLNMVLKNPEPTWPLKWGDGIFGGWDG